MGVTFKENCPDIRNSGVVSLINRLINYYVKVSIFDPMAHMEEVKREYGLKISNKLNINQKYDSIILAVAHSSFIKINLQKMLNKNGFIYDIKGVIKRSKNVIRL